MYQKKRENYKNEHNHNQPSRRTLSLIATTATNTQVWQVWFTCGWQVQLCDSLTITGHMFYFVKFKLMTIACIIFSHQSKLLASSFDMPAIIVNFPFASTYYTNGPFLYVVFLTVTNLYQFNVFL